MSACDRLLAIGQRQLCASFSRRFVVASLEREKNPVSILSLHGKQLLTVSEATLYIYSTIGNVLFTIDSSYTHGIYSSILDAVWISRDQIIYTTTTGMFLIELSSEDIKRIFRKQYGLQSISVYNDVIYVATEVSPKKKSDILAMFGVQKSDGTVLTSSDGGVTWSNMALLQPDSERQRSPVIRVPGYNSSHNEVFWVLDMNTTVMSVPNDTRVCICHKPKSISVSCSEVFRLNKTSPFLSYDGNSTMLLTDSEAREIHVFDVSGRYEGPLKLVGANLTSGPHSLATDGRVLYVGLNDSSIMVFNLRRL
jgi:hypothetical protein